MNRRDLRVFALILFVIIFSLSMMFFIQPAEGQTIIPVVNAQFDDSSKTADVEPGNPSGGIVKNTGTIHCDCGSQPQVDVSLTISAGGWGAAITPSSMTFVWGGEEEKPFSVTIAAPEGTSHKVAQNVIVGGSWTGSLGLVGDVDETSMIVFVEQYFDLVLELDEPESIAPGGGGNISFQIFNLGNDEDDFIVDVDNLADLARDGWSIPTIGKLTIEEKGARRISIYVSAPDEEDTYHFEITVTSEKSRLANPDDERSASLDVFVEVKKGGSGSGGGGGGSSDDDDGLPFLSPFELMAMVCVVSLAHRHQRRRSS